LAPQEDEGRGDDDEGDAEFDAVERLPDVLLAAAQERRHATGEDDADSDADAGDTGREPASLRRELPGGDAGDGNPDDRATESHDHERHGEHSRSGRE
jgi:hypothetical protein